MSTSLRNCCSSTTKCKIGSDGSVCLADILNSFNSSIRDEHAWALCYQCAKYYRDCINNTNAPFYIVTDVEQVYLQSDGNVHENTIKLPTKSARKEYETEKSLIADLGMVIYMTLAKDCKSDEEPFINQELEELISDMISDESNNSNLTLSNHETDDEGIERDAAETYEDDVVAGTSKTSSAMKNSITSVEDVISRCEKHLGNLSKSQVEAHYKAVVRALVAEALELSTFLEKVAQGNLPIGKSSQKQTACNLEQLNFSDWAKFWVQVMGELRTGVKLRKVNYSKTPIEYELTPYEILMKDIRSCRYNLKKIMINGDVPSRVRKDAHAIILEFIRSRPPLKKVSERKLAPQQNRTLTPREQLLNSIRKGRKLKPVPAPRSRIPNDDSQSGVAPIAAKRRLIKVDFSQFEDDEEDEDVDNEHEDDESLESPTEPGLWSGECLQTYPTANNALDAYDLATQAYNQRLSSSKLGRSKLEVVTSSNTTAGCYSVPQSRPCSRQSCNSSEAESILYEPEEAKAIQDQLLTTTTSSSANNPNWQDTISLDDRLSLTLQEIVHIRAVLTKAELEALPVEAKVRYDVEMRKVCFLCLKTRFGLLGPWGQKCTICKRTVCSKCCSKLNIPMEHFSSVPVVLLSPSIMCTPEDEQQTVVKSLVNKIMEPDSTTMVLDRSPMSDGKGYNSMESSTISDPGLTTISSSSSSSLGRFRSKATLIGKAAKMDRFKEKGSQMIVCHDCKMMVQQIIDTAKANRSAIRNKTLQSLTLNLSPVF